MARLTPAWRWVAVSMLVGAVYDAAFALAILLFRRPAVELLGLELPEDPVYLGLNGILLLLLAALYVLAFLDPGRYRGLVAVAAAGRILGFLYLGMVWLGGGAAAFAGLAVGDLVLGVAHGVLLAVAMRQPPDASA